MQDGGTLGEMEGYNNSDETPERAAADSAVKVAAELFGRMGNKKGRSETSALPVNS